MADINSIKPLIIAKLATLGLELFGLKFFRAGKRSSLRIFIDKDGGVSIEDCERVSHELSILLDVENFCSSPYTLEVSSPGLDRPLKTPRDFSRVKGQIITVTLSQSINDKKGFTGTLVSQNETTMSMETKLGPVEIPLSAVMHGKLELDFG